MGFGFPKDERDALWRASPTSSCCRGTSDLRYQWVCVRLAVIDVDEMCELCSTCGAWSCRSRWPPPSTAESARSGRGEEPDPEAAQPGGQRDLRPPG